MWLTEIPSSERIVHMLLRGKCFLCHEALYSTADSDSFSLAELVAHMQMHKETLEIALPPEAHGIIAAYLQETNSRVRYARNECAIVGAQASHSIRAAVDALESITNR